MQCDSARQSLQAYVDEELHGQAMVDLEQHIASCPACAHELAQLRSLTSRLRSGMTAFPVPPALAAACAARLERASIVMRRQREAAARLRPWRAVALAAASLALAIVGLSIISPPAYAMVVSSVARLGSQATVVAAARFPLWGQLSRALDLLFAAFGG